jgi:LuxR family transcriptional regulator, maltose regulon positive regulatory protein
MGGVLFMNVEALSHDQFLAVRLFVPSSSHAVVVRPRLLQLLHKGLAYRVILVTAPAGFGKTTLLSSWIQSLPEGKPYAAWVSLDAEVDNLPRFWTYVLTALDHQLPGRFRELLLSLQEQPDQSVERIVTSVINTLLHTQEELALILDDYYQLTDQAVQTSLSMFIDHLPPHFHLILATRPDPQLSLSRLRGRGYLYEIRTDELRCTQEEVMAFLKSVMGIELSEDDIQKVMTRTEGWLAGLQLFGLSLQRSKNPQKLIDQLSGSQRYIFDYLIDEVLGQQDPAIQAFLLQTSILDRLNPSLCDAVMQRSDSQSMLRQMEQANLFITSLDSKRQWYRYHRLFAEALLYRLENTQLELVAVLHRRASRWYAEHNFLITAIQHAFSAHEWDWASQLIARLPLSVLWRTEDTEDQELFLLRHWLKDLPDEIVYEQPYLCLTLARTAYQVTPSAKIDDWLDAAEAILRKELDQLQNEENGTPSDREQQQKQTQLLGEVLAYRAFIQSFREDGQRALPLCEQALALIAPDDLVTRAHIACARLLAYYTSSANDAETALHVGQQSVQFALNADKLNLASHYLGITALYTLGTGQLREVARLAQRGMQIGTRADGSFFPSRGMPMAMYAEVLREWNLLDAALKVALQAIHLLQKIEAYVPLRFTYALLLRIFLSRGELDEAEKALQQLDDLGKNSNSHAALHTHSLTATIDQVRFWLAEGNLDHAVRWARELEQALQFTTAFAHERAEVAVARILLAQQQPARALEKLEPLLSRATAAKRWGHVLGIWLLQAQAYHMLGEEQRALDVLALAVHQGEPENYVRSFADEGPIMADLLTSLRDQQGPTPYLDTLLDAFPAQRKTDYQFAARSSETPVPIKPEPKLRRTRSQPLSDDLSEREREVLQKLVQGASNQDIATMLTISIETVKRHMTNIFLKLGVKNRVQAVARARTLGLISDGM